jgi:hypothetical protein
LNLPSSRSLSRITSAFLLFVLALSLSSPGLAQSTNRESRETENESATARSLKDGEDDSPEQVQRREEWFMLPRILPGKSSADLLRQATEFKFKQREITASMEKVRRQLAAAMGTTIQPFATVAVGNSSTVWTPLGPKPIVHDPIDTQNYGNLAGRVSAIAVDQSDATGATVYAGGAYGGVWKSTNATAAASTVSWTPILDDQATLAVGAIAVNGNTILVGTGEAKSAVDSYYGLGILRSTNGGATWSLIQTADGGATRMAGLGFSHLEFSKDNSNLVVGTTIGTGLSVGLGALTGNYVRGVFYSNDAGATWHSVTITEGGVSFQASSNGLVYNATQHKFYVAMRYHGVYSSSDGATWTRTAAQPGGLTLTDCPSSVSFSCPFGRGEIAIRPDKDEMYVWYANDSYASQGVFKSTNGGSSWTALSMTPANTCDDTGTCASYQLFYNMTIAALPNKVDSDTTATDVYIGSGNLFKCTINAANPACGGSSEPYKFMDVTHVYRSACANVAKVHPDQHAIAYSNGNPQIVYFGNDGGVYRTLNSGGINTQSCTGTLPFDNLNNNLGSLTQFIWATPDPSDATGVLAGAQDNGTSATGATIRSSHGVSGQQFFEMMSGDGGHTDIRSDNNSWYQSFTDATINLCTQGQNCGFNPFAASVYIDNTSASGDNLSGDSSAFYAPFMVDRQSKTHFIVGTCRVWRGSSSTPFGGTAISYNLNNFASQSTAVCTDKDSQGNSLPKISALAMGGPVTANGSQAIYAAMDDGSIYRTLTADSGVTSWADVTPPTTLNWGTSAAGFAFNISSLAVDTTDTTGRTVYATVQGFGANHVLMSTNGGTTWTGIGGPGLNGLPDAPANSMAIDPDDHTVIYIGTDVGVFVTSNGGATWTEVGPTEPGGSATGYLPNTVVTHIEFNKAGGGKQLVASTYGRGVWSASLVAPSATMISPQNGSALTGSSATFSWTSVAGTSQYWIWIGSTVGTNDIYNQGQALNSSTTITGLPTNGSTLYLRLFTFINNQWLFADYTYTAAPSIATMLTPANGSQLIGSSTTFTWTNVNGAVQYWIWAGHTPGGNDIYNQGQGLNTSGTVSGLPIDGSTLYLRLFTYNGTWTFHDYQYTAAKASVMLTPTPGSTLASTTQFTWTIVAGAQANFLWIGSALGGNNLYNAQISGGTTSLSGLPVNGSTLFVRLFTLANDTWLWNDYTYIASASKATMLSPSVGSLLAPSQSFTWTSVPGTQTYWIWVGTTAGGNDLYNQGQGLNTSATLSSLPTNGLTVYLRLFTFINNTWLFNDYTYQELSRAVLANPVPGSTLSGASVTFNWTQPTNIGSALQQYWMWIGSSTGMNDLYNQSQAKNLSTTVNSLPTNGAPVYVRLFTEVGDSWLFNDYVYTASNAKAVMTAPAQGSTITGGTAHFTWTSISGTDQYWMWIGTSVGGLDLYNQGQALNTAATVISLPTNGSTIYVRLFTYKGGVWLFNDYTYITSP